MLTHKYIQQLLFSDTGATAYSSARFGRGTGGIFLDNLYCTGRESRLVDCTHSGVGVHNCDHSADAGVRCQGMYPYPQLTRPDFQAVVEEMFLCYL